MTDAEFLQNVKRSVLEIDSEAEVWLFGSRARGDAREDSDWDFYVLTDKAVDWSFKRNMRDHLYDSGLYYDHVISTIIQSKANTPFLKVTDLYQNVMEEGRKL